MARAVLESLRALRPDLQAVYTYFSPSAIGQAQGMPADVSGYLPWDVRAELGELLAAVRPTVLAFTRTEVWPALTSAAVAGGVPTVLCAATLSPGARRRRPLARRILGPTFASLSEVLAISAADAERFLELGVTQDRIGVTGDPSVDSAWTRVRAADPQASYLRPFAGHPAPILVAGSTWRSDEAVLIPTLASLGARLGRAALTTVLAPHEPTPRHLERLERELCRAGLVVQRLADVERRGAVEAGTVVVVDRVGVLAPLYTVGAVAYVGGGFHGAGLHSVIEPAAAGLPVVFGPRHTAARAAGDLLGVGGAELVSDGTALAALLEAWVREPGLRMAIGAKALGYVEGHRGAARRTAEALAQYMPRREVDSDHPQLRTLPREGS